MNLVKCQFRTIHWSVQPKHVHLTKEVIIGGTNSSCVKPIRNWSNLCLLTIFILDFNKGIWFGFICIAQGSFNVRIANNEVMC